METQDAALPPPLFPPASPALLPPPSNSCTLLGGTFGVLIQCGLAAAAIMTLLYKRYTETPRRPWLVWFFDASKQAFAGVLQHVVNLALGIIFATGGGGSECAWYLVNFTLSVICGCFILWAVMKPYRWVVSRFHLRLLVSGEYGNPPSWKPWLAQVGTAAPPPRSWLMPWSRRSSAARAASRVGAHLGLREAGHRGAADRAAARPAGRPRLRDRGAARRLPARRACPRHGCGGARRRRAAAAGRER